MFGLYYTAFVSNKKATKCESWRAKEIGRSERGCDSEREQFERVEAVLDVLSHTVA